MWLEERNEDKFSGEGTVRGDTYSESKIEREAETREVSNREGQSLFRDEVFCVVDWSN